MKLVECKCDEHYIPYLVSDDCNIVSHLFKQLKAASKEGVEVGKINWIRVSNVDSNYAYLDVDELNSDLEKWRKKAKKNNLERGKNCD